MFATGEKVICVDDSHPNPLCTFPDGYVVRGSIYTVVGVGPGGGIRIAGLRVHRAPTNTPLDEILQQGDVGWKRHRFRRLQEPEKDFENTSEDNDLELVGAR